MKPSFLHHLRCPRCAAPFGLTSRRLKQQEILRGELSCRTGHRYPIRQGVARLVSQVQLEEQQRVTASSFASKWKHIPDYGHDRATQSFQYRWYRERYGWDSVTDLASFLKTRRRILEAGTGTGPMMSIYTRYRGPEVFGVDISPAIDSLYRHLGHRPNLHVLQADLRHLPFPKKYFDFIVSDQVLHHTPNTKYSFQTLVHHLAPGGQIAAYVYVRKGPIREFSDDYIRRYTVRMKPEECYFFCRALTYLARALSKLNATIRIPESIPIINIPAGRHDVQRLIYWHMLKCFWNDQFNFETNVMINFDWYHPLIAHRHTPDEVRAWVRGTGLRMIHFQQSLSGISFRAQKPK